MENHPDQQEITVPTVDLCDSVVSSEPHEPPIGVGSGSYYMSLPKEVHESSTSVNDPRPHKHTLKVSANSGPIAIVRIITELDDGKVIFTRYLLPRTTGAQVQIWLRQLKADSTSWPYQYEDVQILAPAQILIKGNNLLIETDRELHGPSQNYKNSRRYGYEHPGYKRPFRVAGWAIIDGTGQLVFPNNDPSKEPFRAFGADSYTMYISFHD